MSKTIFTFENLFRAYLSCRENKRKTINALKFEINLERNLFLLQKELENKTYKPGRSICFAVTEPCPREIFAATFRDRVIHHLLVRELEGIGEKSFIYDSFSCRKNKGTHSAVERLRVFIRKATKNYSRKTFYLKLDISGFFMSINHNILYNILENLILKQNKPDYWKGDVLQLARIIIFHRPTANYIIKGNPDLFNLIPARKSLFGANKGKGLPIGNYSSQFFANLYLNILDHFIKRELKCGYYIRYVDDLVILDGNEKELKYFKDKINIFLKKKLDLCLNFDKIKLQNINKGVDFLGYFIKKDYMLVKKSVVKRFKNKLLSREAKLPGNIKSVWAMVNSYYGHFKHAFSYNLRKNFYKYKILSENFLPVNNYAFLRVILLLIICVFFLGKTGGAKAEYYESGTLESQNLLYGLYTDSVNSFGYDATIPAGTTIQVQFSLHGEYGEWYSSAGVQDAWDTLSDGDHLEEANAIDLSDLEWTEPYFYYKASLLTTATDSTTPILNETRVYYEEGEAPQTSYEASGTLVSKNILDGVEVNNFITGFYYDISSLPSGTSVRIQFSKDGASWYNSSETADGWDNLVKGTHFIDLTGLGWSGLAFYYQIELSGDGTATPVLDEIRVNYSEAEISDYPDPVRYGQNVNFSAEWPASLSVGVKLYVCKAEDGTSSGCGAGGTWCENSNDFETGKTISCSYVSVEGDEGANNYYLYICDADGECSSAETGTFTIISGSASSIKFEGGVKLEGGIKLR